MKIKIVNIKRFLLSIIIILGVITCLSLFLNNNTSLSHGEVNYKTIYVSDGDTLWDISKEQNKNNPYYENKDIRYIVSDIQKINNIENSELAVGQALNLPIGR